MSTVEEWKSGCWLTPLDRDYWHGRLVSFDGTATDDFTESDIADVIAWGCTPPDDWDGTAAAILLLNDGRYVAYETFWGPTGSGFSEDAYGGDADLVFASTLDNATLFGLTDEGRALCKLDSAAAGVPDEETPNG